mmetsp:Transcript_19495/g.62064  ORF Transcript_19495/g.62064 Transcript_19495/m.62064 type:complete len:328 (-) Transcript_19495:781-1764(-)
MTWGPSSGTNFSRRRARRLVLAIARAALLLLPLPLARVVGARAVVRQLPHQRVLGRVACMQAGPAVELGQVDAPHVVQRDLGGLLGLVQPAVHVHGVALERDPVVHPGAWRRRRGGATILALGQRRLRCSGGGPGGKRGGARHVLAIAIVAVAVAPSPAAQRQQARRIAPLRRRGDAALAAAAVGCGECGRFARLALHCQGAPAARLDCVRVGVRVELGDEPVAVRSVLVMHAAKHNQPAAIQDHRAAGARRGRRARLFLLRPAAGPHSGGRVAKEVEAPGVPELDPRLGELLDRRLVLVRVELLHRDLLLVVAAVQKDRPRRRVCR